MVEPILSQEIFGEPTATVGPAPRHTTEGHEHCVYYPAELVEGNRSEDGGFLKGPLVCPHGEEATGGFISEDYHNEIRTAAHKVIGIINMRMIKGLWGSPPVKRLTELTK